MKNLIVLTGLMLMGTHSALAVNTEKAVIDDMEVIEIVGQFSTAKWKRIAESAKVDFYELFNQYNDNKKFRMVCRPTTNVRSRIKRQVCEPMYFKQAMYEQTQISMMMGGSAGINFNRLPSSIEANFVTKRERQEADAHMEKLINEHPELRKKFEFYAKAKRASELRVQLGN